MHVTPNMSRYVGWRDSLTVACDNPLTAASLSASASLFKPD